MKKRASGEMTLFRNKTSRSKAFLFWGCQRFRRNDIEMVGMTRTLPDDWALKCRLLVKDNDVLS